MVCFRYIIVNTLHTGDNKDNKCNVDDTDGTTIALSVEGMAETLNAAVQFPLGTSGPTHPLDQCLPKRGSHNFDD